MSFPVIRIQRGPEPIDLARIRDEKLAAIRAMGRVPKSVDIDGYRVVAEELWRSQHCKCCYCEQRIKKDYNDVEHYRPKASANRLPGCSLRHGYWWLAFTWDNLLFACPSCNRSAKNDHFPIEEGSRSLTPELIPPGTERPLLIDPSSATNPVEHIEFLLSPLAREGSSLYWFARPRAGSVYGAITIQICELNHSDLLELRNHHVKNVADPQMEALQATIRLGDVDRIEAEFQRSIGMLQPSNPYVALTYDVFRYYVKGPDLLRTIGKSWPSPSEVGR